MPTNPIHDCVLRYTKQQIEDAISRRDNYAKQLLNVDGEFNEQGEETLSAEEQRASIESNIRQIEEYLLRAARYCELPPGNLSTTVCPACFLQRDLQCTSLDYVGNFECEIHCVECKTIIE